MHVLVVLPAFALYAQVSFVADCSREFSGRSAAAILTRSRRSLPGIHTTTSGTTGSRGRRPPSTPRRHPLGATNNNRADGSCDTPDGLLLLDLQSDSNQYGRGERHLSAVLNEGDVVAYQTGCWLVDGVTVGTATGSTVPGVAFCRIETMQIVWTHNCEHGVLRGMELVPNEQQYQNQQSGKGFDARLSKVGAAKSLQLTSNFVEFGPEQLLARFSIRWDDEDEPTSCIPLVDLEEAESWILDTE